MNQETHIDRPIFLVGSGRSGTTLLFRILAGHPGLAWFSNFSARFPRYPQVAILHRLYRTRQRHPWPRPLARLMPVPSEAYEIWDNCKPVVDSPYDPPLTSGDVGARDCDCILRTISIHMAMQGGSRFIDKNTRNTRRIEYLNAIFPDARFIHIVRDPRAAAASLLKVNWWPEMKVWCQEGVSPREWSADGQDQAILAAILWREENRYILDRVDLLGDRYYRVHYEDLVSDPPKVLDTILKHCDLNKNDRFDRFVARFPIRDMNYKYKNSLDAVQQNQIMNLAKPIIERLGYEYSMQNLAA